MGALVTVIAREALSKWRHQAPPLFYHHWQEVGRHRDVVPLDPDWVKLARLEEAGVLVAFTVRGGGGQLVGYAGFLVSGHLHYASTKVAVNDVIYLRPEFRRGTTAMRLIRFCEEWLKKDGVVKVTFHEKPAHPFGLLLARCGYAHAENIWDRLL